MPLLGSMVSFDMPDHITPKPALPSSADDVQADLALAEHLARYAHSLVGCGQILEAREAIREAGVAQLRALKGSLEKARSEVTAGDERQ